MERIRDRATETEALPDSEAAYKCTIHGQLLNHAHYESELKIRVAARTPHEDAIYSVTSRSQVLRRSGRSVRSHPPGEHFITMVRTSARQSSSWILRRIQPLLYIEMDSVIYASLISPDVANIHNGFDFDPMACCAGLDDEVGGTFEERRSGNVGDGILWKVRNDEYRGFILQRG